METVLDSPTLNNTTLLTTDWDRESSQQAICQDLTPKSLSQCLASLKGESY